MLLHGFWVLFDFSVLPGTEPKESIPNLIGSIFFEEPIGTGFLRTELLQKPKNRSVRFDRTERPGLPPKAQPKLGPGSMQQNCPLGYMSIRLLFGHWRVAVIVRTVW